MRVILLLLLRTPRFREVKLLAHGHTARRGQSWVLNPANLVTNGWEAQGDRRFLGWEKSTWKQKVNWCLLGTAGNEAGFWILLGDDENVFKLEVVVACTVNVLKSTELFTVKVVNFI